MSEVLKRWNAMDPDEAEAAILPCCGSHTWAAGLVAMRPYPDEADLHMASDRVWLALPEAAWREAFASHPRIGQSYAQQATVQSLAWSGQEQKAAATPDAAQALLEGNRRYEQRFGRIFIVCASGRSAVEILAILETRMGNDEAAEMHEAAEQQRQITQLRLRRWLGGA